MNNKAISDNIWVGVCTLGTSALAIISYGSVVHFLGESCAGIVGVILAVLATATMLGGLGINLALVREASKAELEKRAITPEIGVAVTMAIGTGLLCWLILHISGPALLSFLKFSGDQTDAKYYCALVGAVPMLMQLAGVGRALNQSQCKFRTNSIIDLSTITIQGMGTIMAAYYFRNLRAIGMINLLVSGFQLFAYAHSLHRSWGIALRPGWSKSAFMRLWHFGRWPHFGSIFAIIGDSFDRILLGVMFGAASVPVYSMAKSFYTQIHALLAAQAYSIFPRLAATESIINLKYEVPLISLVSLFSSWIYLAVFLVGPVIAAISAGEAFANKVSLCLIVFCIMGWTNSLCLIVYFSKMASGYSKLAMFMNIFSGPGTLLAMWLLGWTGGLHYAIAGQLFMLIGVFWLLSLDESNRPTWRCLLLRLQAAIPMGFLAILGGWSFFWFRQSFLWVSVPVIFTALILLLAYLPVACRVSIGAFGNTSFSKILYSIICALPIPSPISVFLANLLGARPSCLPL